MIATIIAAVVGLAGVIFGLFKYQAAKVSAAQADTANAQRDTAVDKLNAVKADQAVAQQAQQATVDATAGRTSIEADIAAKPAADIQGELRENFSRD